MKKRAKKSSKQTSKKSLKTKQNKTDNPDTKKIKDLLIRYSILLVVVFLGIELFYAIFGPITIYATYWMFELFFDATLNGNLIVINQVFPIEIIGACIAGSAYVLLMILNLSTPRISFKNRVYSILISFGIILVLNLLRIFLLGNVYVFNFSYFDFLHNFFWYFLSIFFVILAWFSQVKLFNIKEIPLYTDLKYLYSLTSFK